LTLFESNMGSVLVSYPISYSLIFGPKLVIQTSKHINSDKRQIYSPDQYKLKYLLSSYVLALTINSNFWQQSVSRNRY